jgi:hypothetical protein
MPIAKKWTYSSREAGNDALRIDTISIEQTDGMMVPDRMDMSMADVSKLKVGDQEVAENEMSRRNKRSVHLNTK